MTVPVTAPRNDYIGNNTTDTYDYEFRILDETHLKVSQADADDIESELVLNTDYTVTGVGSFSGGSITLSAGNLATGYKLTIRRYVPIKQSTDVRNQGGYLPETVEDALDYIVYIAQQLQDEMLRSVKQPETEVGTGSLVLPAVDVRKGEYFAFDATDGDPIASGGPSSVPVSTFMETVVDDTTAAAAFTTLGVTAFVQTLLDDADAAAARATLGAQLSDANLTSLSALGTVADRLAYTTGVDTWAEAPVTSFARTLLDDTNAAAARTTLGIDIPITALKTSDESVVSSSTMQDDDELFVTLEANTVYSLMFWFEFESASVNPDGKFEFIGPSGTLYDYMYDFYSVNAGITGVNWKRESTPWNIATFTLAANDPKFFKGVGSVRVASTGGTFKLQWAQQTSDATATILRANSWMRLHKIG